MSAPEIKHTPLPWIAELNEKSGTMSFLGKRPDGNVRVSDGLGHLFHIDLAARESADAIMFPEMSEVSKADASLVLTAVNSHHALQARVKELEEENARLREALKPFADFGSRNTACAIAGDGYVWTTDAMPEFGPNPYGIACAALQAKEG
jgi:hypothetical protein